MKIDPETGLPALPEGYVWVVRRHRDGYHVDGHPSYLIVSLCKVKVTKIRKRTKHVTLSDRDIDARSMTPDQIRVTILDRAKKLYEANRDRFEWDDLWDKTEEFVGVYPPKKL